MYMGENLMKSKSVFSFHLDGESSVDAIVLSKTIADMADLSKEMAKQEDEQAFLKMNVTPFKNGSFEIVFEAVCEIGETIITNPMAAAAFASSVVTSVVGVFQIKRFLQGKKAKKVETDGQQIKIENERGEVLYAPKSSGAVLNSIRIDSLVVNISKYAQENNPSGGFSISSDKDTVRCKPSDLDGMVSPFPIVEESSCKRQVVVTELAIKKPDLLGFSKWSFRLNNRTIEANVNDENWLKKVHTGEITIKAGDSIKASLEVLIDIDAGGVPVEGSQRYTVLSVAELVSIPYQVTL